MLVVSLSFVNSFTSAQFDFLGANSRVRRFVPSVQARGDDRSRMQAHGFNPRVPYYGGLQIHQEGNLAARVGGGSALIATRDDFIEALLGDLSEPQTEPESGTLTVKYAGWPETASGPVIVSAYESEVAADTGDSCPYTVDWVAFRPYFIGTSSGNPRYL